MIELTVDVLENNVIIKEGNNSIGCTKQKTLRTPKKHLQSQTGNKWFRDNLTYFQLLKSSSLIPRVLFSVVSMSGVRR